MIDCLLVSLSPGFFLINFYYFFQCPTFKMASYPPSSFSSLISQLKMTLEGKRERGDY